MSHATTKSGRKKNGLRRVSSEFTMPSKHKVPRRQSIKREIEALSMVTGSTIQGSGSSNSQNSEDDNYDPIKHNANPQLCKEIDTSKRS